MSEDEWRDRDDTATPGLDSTPEQARSPVEEVPPAQTDIPAPRVLRGRYEVGELIGRGGMAEVHDGHDLRLGRSVAIKILRNDLARDTSFLARFRREAQSAAGLNHPAIVAVYDSGEQEVLESGGAPIQVPFIVMERVEGRTLRDVLNDEQVLDPDEAARITASVLAGMDYAHSKGIVHRDIKPANVMISRAGAVKVMDFGIARALADTAATMTQTQAVLGTARYLSPEQAQGNPVDARSDLYSTGCLLYELMAGRTPFQGDPVALVYQHLGEQPKPPSTYQPDLPATYDAIALHSLAKTPETRYQSAAEFREDLMSARAGTPISEAAAATVGHPSVGAPVAAEVAGESFASGVPVSPVTEAIPSTQSHGAGSGPPTGGSGEDERTDEIPINGDRGTSRYWVFGGLALLALVGIAFLVFRMSSPNGESQAGEVQVPFLINMGVEDAQEQLAQSNLKAAVEQEESTEPEGNVIEQDPNANTPVDTDSTVTLTVSSGPNALEIPDVIGFTEEAARNRLDAEGLSVAAETDTTNDVDFSADEVVTTKPESGESISPDSEVILTLASGLVEVPNVVGQESGAAVASLRALRLSPATTFEDSSESSPGTVLKQSLAEGEESEYGTRITLTVAQEATPTVTETQTETITSPPTRPTQDPGSPNPDPGNPDPGNPDPGTNPDPGNPDPGTNPDPGNPDPGTNPGANPDPPAQTPVPPAPTEPPDPGGNSENPNGGG